MRRVMARALGAAVMALPIAAFAADIQFPSFMWGEANNAPILLELKSKFEQENPGNTVVNSTVPISVFWDKQFADTASGRPADIATLYDPDIRAYLEADLLEPLDEYYKAAGIDLDKLVPTKSLAQKNGKIYGVPMQINARALFVNLKLFKEAGLQPPKTFAEFENAMKAMRKPDRQQFGFATVSKPGSANLLYIEIMPIVIGMGGSFFKEGKPNASAPETVAALKFIKGAYDDQLIPRGMDTPSYRQLFAQGKVGMYATGSFFAGVVQSASKETYADLGAVPLPLPSGKTMSLTAFLAVPKGARNKELAGKLLMRMLKDDIQAKTVEAGKTHPGMLGKIPASFSGENPWFKAFEDASLNAKSYAPEGVEQYGNEIVKIVAEHVEAMLFNGVSADETGQRLQKALTEFIATKKN
jgi:multiple sugar transport system substrate-binding protein